MRGASGQRAVAGYWYVRRVAPKVDPPLLYVADGATLILIASNYGRPGHPAWHHNLIGNPRVEVLAGYSDYEVRAGNRTIPLIRLTRTE